VNGVSASPLGALIAQTFAFYRAQIRLVLIVTVPVVAFVELAFAAGLGEFGAGVHKTVPVGDTYVEVVAILLVMVPLVTAMLARAVVISREESGPLDPRRVAGEGLELFAPVFVPALLYVVGVFAGSTLFLLPGIYVAVSWYFVVQAVVVDRARGIGAIARSSALVRGNWWRSAGTGACFLAIVVLFDFAPNIAFGELAVSTNSFAPLIVGEILLSSIALPFVAVGATFYYLELRARAGGTAVSG
jgi:hypothetical protein